MSSSVRVGAASRPSTKQGTRMSMARHGLNASVSRHGADRRGAASPAESISSSAAATAGTKRKERDFDSESAVVGPETNINVVVRCRGRSAREVRENSALVVNTDGGKGDIVELSMGPNALTNKTYNFDRVFSPAADQNMVFDDTVKPILEEVGRTGGAHCVWSCCC